MKITSDNWKAILCDECWQQSEAIPINGRDDGLPINPDTGKWWHKVDGIIQLPNMIQMFAIPTLHFCSEECLSAYYDSKQAAIQTFSVPPGASNPL